MTFSGKFGQSGELYVSKKVALITAGGSDIGAGASRRLSADGFRIAVFSSLGKGQTLAGEFGGFGVTESNQSVDDLSTLVDGAMTRRGRIDVPVNSAGHGPRAPILELGDENRRTGLDVYFLNVVRPTRLVTPIMQEQKSDAIINISTFAPFEPDPVFPTSGVVRAGLAAYSKLLADTCAGDNIRMNNVLSGFINCLPEKAAFREWVPLGRYGETDEISAAIAFLTSEVGVYTTGQNSRVDGGMTRSV